jgi:hypothetical protein
MSGIAGGNHSMDLMADFIRKLLDKIEVKNVFL